MVWILRWNENGPILVKSACHMLSFRGRADPWCATVWSPFSPIKFKVFCWLMLHTKLNARTILRREQVHLESFTCIFCFKHTESREFFLVLQCISSWMADNSVFIQDPSSRKIFTSPVNASLVGWRIMGSLFRIPLPKVF